MRTFWCAKPLPRAMLRPDRVPAHRRRERSLGVGTRRLQPGEHAQALRFRLVLRKLALGVPGVGVQPERDDLLVNSRAVSPRRPSDHGCSTAATK